MDTKITTSLSTPSPCFILEEEKLKRNLAILKRVQDESGAKILLALKGFAMFSVFDILRKVLAGTTASSRNEALLGREEFGKELHTYCVAYRDEEFDELCRISNHLVFNSFSQWARFAPRVQTTANAPRCGLRINPEVHCAHTEMYNPCCQHSRLGITAAEFKPERLDGISGLHFHALCGNNADSLEAVLAAVEERFGPYLEQLSWINFGGGHHITRVDYDVDRLIRLIQAFRCRHGLDVYLEPGEAVALNAGVMVATVMDLVKNEINLAILDTSASAHMPDVLEMPYRPDIDGAGNAGEYAHTYRLTGNTCLAGDIIGDYSFPNPLAIGDRLIFGDMAHYSMVKTTTFNGINLPSIGILRSNGTFELVKSFDYLDYRSRLS